MRITDALKPVTDALATAGMSLESATYKDGKIHATLNTEAPKATGKPGSGPECPPEGYRLSSELSVRPHESLLWMEGETRWKNPGTLLRDWRIPGDAAILAIAVPIAPKSEPVKLSDQEKIVGWRGPSGFRLQTFQNRDVQCAVCKKTIKAGERLARWRHRFPENADPIAVQDDHLHAHVDCLYEAQTAKKVGFQRGASFSLYMDKLSISFHMADVPKWLQEKRRKYDAQQSTP